MFEVLMKTCLCTCVQYAKLAKWGLKICHVGIDGQSHFKLWACDAVDK